MPATCPRGLIAWPHAPKTPPGSVRYLGCQPVPIRVHTVGLRWPPGTNDAPAIITASPAASDAIPRVVPPAPSDGSLIAVHGPLGPVGDDQITGSPPASFPATVRPLRSTS